MRILLGFVVGVCVGIAASFLLGPSGWRHWYQAKNELVLTDNHGKLAGHIPAGTRIVAADRLEESVDFGWTGCIPIQFESMSAARSSGVTPATRLESIVDVTLNASAASAESAATGESGSESRQAGTSGEETGAPRK